MLPRPFENTCRSGGAPLSVAWLAALVLFLAGPTAAQQMSAADDTSGFRAIFDGKTLSHWDGDQSFWRVESGSIVGETTVERPLKANTFITWRGGRTKDFELRLQYRISNASGANSGIQFRSSALPEQGRWVLKGYQADIDAANTYTGQIYEEQGRGFLARRGQAVRVADAGQVTLLGSLGEPDVLRALVKNGDWNEVHLVVRGNTILQFLNGHLTSLLVDEDTNAQVLDGLLGLQLHAGHPMKVEFRNILLKTLPAVRSP